MNRGAFESSDNVRRRVSQRTELVGPHTEDDFPGLRYQHASVEISSTYLQGSRGNYSNSSTGEMFRTDTVDANVFGPRPGEDAPDRVHPANYCGIG